MSVSVIRKVSFQKTTDGSYKFYEIDLEHDEPTDRYWVTRRWGRIGTVGQSARETFTFETHAQEFMDNKILKRVDRGYELLLDKTFAAGEPDLSSDKRLVASALDFRSDLLMMGA